MFWSIWLCRNDVVFDFKPKPSIIHVLFRETYWLRSWRLLHKDQTQQEVLTVCRSLEVVAVEIFVRYGWKSKCLMSD
jgi:hypothetical protein